MSKFPANTEMLSFDLMHQHTPDADDSYHVCRIFYNIHMRIMLVA